MEPQCISVKKNYKKLSLDNQKEQAYVCQVYQLCEKYYILSLPKSVTISLNTPATDTSNVALRFLSF